MMMKYASTLVALLMLIPMAAAAQTARDVYDSAYKQLESGDCASALRTVDAADRAIGPNPRIESLRSICYREQNDLVNAKLALDRYLRLVPSTITASDHHKAMLALAESVDVELQAADRRFIEQLNKERLQAADASTAAVQQRLELAQQSAAAERTSRLYAVYNASADKKAFDDALKNVLDGKQFKGIRLNISSHAQSVAKETAESISSVLGAMIGRQMPFHVFPDEPTSDAVPFKLLEIRIIGKTIDFKAEGHANRGITLQERGTFQGFDLTRLESYTTEAGVEGAIIHRFQFSEPLIWRRGAARYSDGKYFNNNISSSQGSLVLRIQVPEDISDRIQTQFTELIAAAKGTKILR